MKYFTYLTLTLVVLIPFCGALLMLDQCLFPMINLTSTYGSTFLVRNTSKDAMEAANMLGAVKTSVSRLLDRISGSGMRLSVSRRETVSHLSRVMRNMTLSENCHPNKTSFVVNKGEAIVLCLRREVGYAVPESGSLEYSSPLVSLNTLMFIVMHELAHCITPLSASATVVGRGHNIHSEEFYKNFRFLLYLAEKFKSYEVIDYRRNSVRYCGTTIKSSPLQLSHTDL